MHIAGTAICREVVFGIAAGEGRDISEALCFAPISPFAPLWHKSSTPVAVGIFPLPLLFLLWAQAQPFILEITRLRSSQEGLSSGLKIM